MGALQFTCPRCLYTEPLRADLRFCPRCGLVDAKAAWEDQSPMDLSMGGKTFRVMDRIAVGSICAIYRCQFQVGSASVEGVLKVARDARASHWIVNEAQILRKLIAADTTRKFSPFFPQVEASISLGDATSPEARAANVLKMDRHVSSIDELYTLAEVREAYPNGLDARHMAWIWRRLLNVLGFVHANKIIHGAVLPMHVLIEPREHKLVLIDWCCAREQNVRTGDPLDILTGGYNHWFKREGALRNAPTPGLDIGLAARCMIDLLGGEPLAPAFPPATDPALIRYLSRCVNDNPMRPDAWRLLDDFDRLIDAMWGQRQFRVLEMPPKRKENANG